jgi:Xaa-Pro aminopeptidase
MMLQAERIRMLRDEMRRENIDIYIVPTADFHASEYVGDHFKCREFITGFTGSAGTAVITASDAGLWTDGRYFVQAEQELNGSGVTLFRAGTEGTPSVREYIKSILFDNCCIGFDGRCISDKSAADYLKLAEKVQGSVRMDVDLVGRIWKDRPEQKSSPVRILDESVTGESITSKLSRIREKMKEAEADVHIISSLYDISWILNMRGDDISHVPVFLSFLCLTDTTADLYIAEDCINEEARHYLDAAGVRIFSYDTVYEAAASIPADAKVLIDRESVNALLVSRLHENTQIIHQMNPSELMRAIKNETEIECTKRAHIRDGVIMTKFIYWLKKNIANADLTEYDAAQYLDQLRLAQDECTDLSFDTISAYGPNAAMMHYQAKKDTAAKLNPCGMLLVDSGGQYTDGTTDITRTILLGPVTQEQKASYTRVLIGNLRLADVKFLQGCTGYTLDILAREKLWSAGIDYRSGTGHGVGHILNVHEGPNAFRWKRSVPYSENDIIQPGMITTDEPGCYIDGEYGIRIENELLCVPDEKNEYGQFLRFEQLTFCPIDTDGIDVSLMNEEDLDRLNQYHKMVYEVISPYLDEEEKEWLHKCTQEITHES